MSLGAIILAGGRATRLEGAAKPLLEIDGISLLRTATDAVDAAGCLPIIAVGPSASDDPRLTWAREDPPFGGPVAGIVAGLENIETTQTLILSADLPRAPEAVSFLLEAAALGAYADGLCLADDSGRPQWLIGLYRTSALRTAAAALPEEGANAAMRELLADLEIATVRAPPGVTADVDTWEDLRTARLPAGAPDLGGPMPESSRSLPPEALEGWAAALRERFGLSPEDLPISVILDLARDVATGVARPAAPFSTFVAGLVAGRAGGSPAEVAAAVASITDLAAAWRDRPVED